MMSRREILMLKLEALSTAIIETAVAVRAYKPDHLLFRRHAKELDAAASAITYWVEVLNAEPEESPDVLLGAGDDHRAGFHLSFGESES